MNNIDFSKLNKIYDLARKAGVGFTLVYAESDDSWYFSVNSVAPSEEWIGKNRFFDVACEDVLEWIGDIAK